MRVTCAMDRTQTQPAFSVGATAAALAFVAVTITTLVLLVLDQTRDSILRHEADKDAARWIAFFAREVPNLDVAFHDGRLTPEQIETIDRGQLVGDVFRFKMFDQMGRLFFISDTGAFSFENDQDSTALNVADTGLAQSELEMGHDDPDRPDFYAESYAPVYDESGTIIGVMEVYVDQSGTHALLAASFHRLLIGLPLLCALVFLIPSAAYLAARHQKSRREALLEAARYDPLTGMLDRRHFEQEAQALLDRESRAGRSVGVIFLDVDRFKSVNDSIGHAGGDAYLTFLTNAILSLIRREDVIGRYGGDEFAVLLPELDAEGLQNRAEEMCAAVRKSFIYRGQIQTGSLSAGYALVPPGTPLKTALDRADAAAYAAKSGGRDRACGADAPEAPTPRTARQA